MLNTLLDSNPNFDRIKSSAFPQPEGGEAPRPLPEDFAMRGLLWVEYPDEWFPTSRISDDEKYFEVASMTESRKERVLWLGCRIAEAGKWLSGRPYTYSHYIPY